MAKELKKIEKLLNKFNNFFFYNFEVLMTFLLLVFFVGFLRHTQSTFQDC